MMIIGEILLGINVANLQRFMSIRILIRLDADPDLDSDPTLKLGPQDTSISKIVQFKCSDMTLARHFYFFKEIPVPVYGICYKHRTERYIAKIVRCFYKKMYYPDSEV